MTEALTLSDLLEMKRAAKAEQEAIACAGCGKTGVANDPDAALTIGVGPVRFYHAECLVRPQPDLPKAGSFY